MNNLLKITVVMFGALFLFSCDSSNTAKVTPTGNAFTISANVQGLNGTLSLYSGNDILPFTTNGIQKFPTPISEGSKYSIGIVVDTKPFNQTCTIAANGSGDNMVGDVVADVTCVDNGSGGGALSSVEKGKIYYMSECAVCHRAGGTIDPSSTFGTNGDLAGDYKIAKANSGEAAFFTNMHLLGPKRNLMGRFNNVDTDNLADLKAYLLSIAP